MTRGEIWWADFGMPFGSEPGFRRPVLIIQDDAFNRSKIHTIIVAPFTTNLILEHAPGNVFIDQTDSGLSKDSILVVSQITTIDRARLIEPIKKLNNANLAEVDEGIKLVLNL
ncbi:MAG: type II toxin-antitoxin system PemK/MazF family toxin [Spirochaetes bacterium]|nr:type II toxin-antitoxin system PemK/MazF family toxin [Spirochaetota bacterium]MBU0953898.1 type II toxin-antitoxin system PemK/MazF family toxin [Spirochaetota bacterium]